MTDAITELAELLREALFQQPDAVEGWHAPWVSDDATPPGLIQVDGDLDLNILAAALSGWVRQQQAEAHEQVVSELRVFLPEWDYPPHVVSALCLELKARNPYAGADT
jgi:hypothetical protein